MKDIYYIQSQARRIHKCIYSEELPQGRVCPEYLRGLTEKSFWKAVTDIRNIFRDFYTRAENDPASLNLPLVEIEGYRSTSNEARNGNGALLNFPAALLSIGVNTRFTEGTLCGEITDLRRFFSELKCKYLQEQLSLLSDYGFHFHGLSDAKLPKSGTIRIDYPDNPDTLVVIAAMGDKFKKYMSHFLQQVKVYGLTLLEQFVFITPGIFVDDTELLPPKTIEHMACVVGKEYGEILRKIVDGFKGRGLTLQLETAFLKNRFFNQKGKDTLTYIEYGDYKSIHPFGNEKMALRLKLNNPDAYADKVASLPPHLSKAFSEVWCGNCAEKCNRRIIYHLNGEEKRACGCFFFAFEAQNEEDLEMLMELYDLEQNARAKK